MRGWADSFEACISVHETAGQQCVVESRSTQLTLGFIEKISSVRLVSSRLSSSSNRVVIGDIRAEVSEERPVLIPLMVVWPELLSTEEPECEVESDCGRAFVFRAGNTAAGRPAEDACGPGTLTAARPSPTVPSSGSSVTLRTADCRPTSSNQSNFSFAPTSRLWSPFPGCVDFSSFA